MSISTARPRGPYFYTNITLATFAGMAVLAWVLYGIWPDGHALVGALVWTFTTAIHAGTYALDRYRGYQQYRRYANNR
jgi:hypothetical protein